MYNICVVYTPFATQLYVHVRICTCCSLLVTKFRLNLYSYVKTTIVPSVTTTSRLQCSPGSNLTLHVFSFLTVPSAPRNLTLESVSTDATLLSASWVRPLPANGIITAYTLHCTGTEEQFYEDQIVPEQFSQSLEGNVTSTTLEGLLPFTLYECNITANTSAGEGDESPSVVMRTNETCK